MSSPPPELARPSRSGARMTRGLAWLAAVLVAVPLALLWAFRKVLLPFVIAGLIAYVLAPAVRALAARRVPRWIAVLLVYFVTASAVGVFSWFFVPRVVAEGRVALGSVQAFAARAPELYRGLQDAVLTWLGAGDDEAGAGNAPAGEGDTNASDARSVERGGASDDEPPGSPGTQGDAAAAPQSPGPAVVVESRPGGAYVIHLDRVAFETHKLPSGAGVRVRAVSPAESAGTNQAPDLRSVDLRREVAAAFARTVAAIGDRLVAWTGVALRAVVRGATGGLVGTIVVMMVAAFLLIGAPDIRAAFFEVLPPPWHAGARELGMLVDEGLAGVVRGQLLICGINGVLTGVGFSFLIPEYAFALALLAAVLSIVPIFGTILSTVPAVLAGLTHSWGTAFGVLGWVLGVHFLEANLLNPKIMGSAARIHPVLIVFALIAGEHAAGIAGIVLAVPVLVVIKGLYVFAYRRLRPALWTFAEGQRDAGTAESFGDDRSRTSPPPSRGSVSDPAATSGLRQPGEAGDPGGQGTVRETTADER